MVPSFVVEALEAHLKGTLGPITKGFSFAKPEDNSGDIFVPPTVLYSGAAQGDEVDIEIDPTPPPSGKKRKATKCTLLRAASVPTPAATSGGSTASPTPTTSPAPATKPAPKLPDFEVIAPRDPDGKNGFLITVVTRKDGVGAKRLFRIDAPLVLMIMIVDDAGKMTLGNRKKIETDDDGLVSLYVKFNGDQTTATFVLDDNQKRNVTLVK